MMDEVICPHCKAGVVMDDSLRGHNMHCPWCQTEFVVPATPGEPPTAADRGETSPVLKTVADQEETSPVLKTVADQEETSPVLKTVADREETSPVLKTAANREETPPIRPMAEVPQEPDIQAESAPAPEPLVQPMKATPEEKPVESVDAELDEHYHPSSKPTPPPSMKPPPPPPPIPSTPPAHHDGYDLNEQPVEAKVVPEHKPAPASPPPPPPPTSRATMPCPHCAGPILVTPELRGRHVICPHCRRGLTVPWTAAMKAAPSPIVSTRTPVKSAPMPQGCIVAILVAIGIFIFFVMIRGCS